MWYLKFKSLTVDPKRALRLSVPRMYAYLRHVKFPTAKENSEFLSETFFQMILADNVTADEFGDFYHYTGH